MQEGLAESIKGITQYGDKPIQDLKSIKNEVQGFGDRHGQVALARCFAWLEAILEKGEEETGEWGGAEVLEKYRS